MIPNIVHFIYPAWENTRPLSYLNYISVKSALRQSNNINFWIDGDPVQNEWWDKIKSLVSIRRRPMKGEYRGTKIVWPQYQSDVTRLEILQEEGGIYLDTDVIVMRRLDDFMDGQFTIGAEPTGNSLSNAIILSEHDDPFVIEWLDRMPKALQSETWADGGVVTPYKLAQDWPLHIRIVPSAFLCPLDIKAPYLFMDDKVNNVKLLVKNSYTIHVYETYWRDLVRDITPEWVKKNPSAIFSEIVRGLE